MKIFDQYRGLRKENYIFFIGSIVTNLGSMIWPVMTLILNQKMGLSAANVALVMILAGIVSMPFSLLGGKWADKHNKKRIIVFFDTISVVFYIACAFIPLSWITLIVLFIASLLQSMEGPAYQALIADITKTEDRERAYSLSYLGKNIGLVASPAIAGVLFTNYLWLSFLISGLAIGFSTLLIAFFVKDITPEKEEITEAMKYQESNDTDSVWTILKTNKVLLIYILVMALYWGAYNQYGYLMPIDLARVHGDHGAAIYGTVSSLNCIIVVLFTPFITKLLAKICYTKKNVMSIFLVLIGYITFLLGLGHIPTYYVAITLFTWGEIISSVISGPYLTERIPASHRGRVTSVMGIVQGIIQGVFMYSSGYVYDSFGSVAAWVYVFIILAIAVLFAIILIFADRKAYADLYKSDIHIEGTI